MYSNHKHNDFTTYCINGIINEHINCMLWRYINNNSRCVRWNNSLQWYGIFYRNSRYIQLHHYGCERMYSNYHR